MTPVVCFREPAGRAPASWPSRSSRLPQQPRHRLAASLQDEPLGSRAGPRQVAGIRQRKQLDIPRKLIVAVGAYVHEPRSHQPPCGIDDFTRTVSRAQRVLQLQSEIEYSGPPPSQCGIPQKGSVPIATRSTAQGPLAASRRPTSTRDTCVGRARTSTLPPTPSPERTSACIPSPRTKATRHNLTALGPSDSIRSGTVLAHWVIPRSRQRSAAIRTCYPQHSIPKDIRHDM